jgi:hydrocephalus-inducing protein
VQRQQDCVTGNANGIHSVAEALLRMQGRGVLPSLTVTEPPAPSGDGSMLLDFKRVAPAGTAQRTLAVRNNGGIAASARFKLDEAASAVYSVLEGETAFTLQPGEHQSFSVAYAPAAVGKHSCTATLAVAQNLFESVRIALMGECFQEDIAMLGLPSDEPGVLRLPDTAIGKPRAVDFVLQNNSAAKTFRVAWPSHANLSVTPAALHLPPRTTAAVQLVFNATTAVALAGSEFTATASEITLADSATAAIAWRAGAGADGAPAVPEPKSTPVKGGDKKVPLKVWAVANDCRYECATKEVTFKATPMLQTRTFSFPIKNTGTTKLPFTIAILLPDGREDTSGLYAAVPASGVINAGAECAVSLRFSPTEVQDCRRRLAVRMQDLAAGVPPLEVELSGKVQRPWCHFEVRMRVCAVQLSPRILVHDVAHFGDECCAGARLKWTCSEQMDLGDDCSQLSLSCCAAATERLLHVGPPCARHAVARRRPLAPRPRNHGHRG